LRRLQSTVRWRDSAGKQSCTMPRLW
jgi:hypothetical protein